MSEIIIVGGGASGLMAAIKCAEKGNKVTVFEHQKIPGKKLLITGKGRCNVTNNSDVDTILKNIPRNSRFMYSALNSFDSSDTMSFFEALGVKLKTERGKRVFPESDKSSDIVDALVARAKDCGVKFIFEGVREILVEENRAIGVKTAKGKYFADAVIIATGGKSYPKTGSTGDGYKFAERLGINVTEISPSLVPIEIKESFVASLSGLSLRNVTLKLFKGDSTKPVYEELGEMLFTHFGVSGPLVLTSSAHMESNADYRYEIDLKPALDEKKLDDRILRDFSLNTNRAISNTLTKLLPSSLILPILKASRINPQTKVNSVTKEQRKVLVKSVKGMKLTVSGKRPIDEAVITRGGIDTKEINPKTMESKKISSLYFIGEVLDVDAYTGGFNLQIAFSTANAVSNNFSI
ncbi:MAG: NAD(P)/FAD-dependent oxidoreductase [Ruminococcus sp.]|nr:NAD(P)/FAD-dependent oxidoreductase [Ruminococcus sp.]